ncbi:major facilitator superfamily domain-containing protein [Achaetomium macrosporum]|uniref:Major facilitator superfamily domain-containing protein n=1 Tax=Achaetomium macrosporum TaxID=79813 RepID=A0AAN7H9X2_9PEZI|nr:major facilitator superfamily domain-containing protein [Achaetomium macrosporum]
MYLAYKYARKKYRERQAAKAAVQALPDETGPYTQDGPRFNDKSALTASPSNDHDRVHSDTSYHSPAAEDQSKVRKPDPKAEDTETPEERAEKARRRKYRLKIIAGLFLPFTLQALDTTIIASALKFIADDFHELKQLNWIITAFNLTSAAFLPFFAQLADVFGRHATLQTALAIITVGSALCTAAPTTAFPVLLLGRALQGVGAAGINICVRTVLADRVSLAEYAKNWTVFAIVSGISFSIGPVAGGYLTQASWRWCFAINLPVAVVGIGLVVVLLRKELLGPLPLERVVADGEALELLARQRRRRRGDATTKTGRFLTRLGTIDFGGQLLFLWGFGLLVLAFTWGGGTYPWDSAAVLAPLVIGGVLAAAWFVYEWAMVPGRVMARVFPMQKAMMPWQLLMQRDIGLLLVVNFANGAAMFAVMYFMDLYFTLVQGHEASKAGISLLYYLPGLGAGAYGSMYFTNVWPRQTVPVLFLGSISAAVGITVISWACDTGYLNLIYGMMALTGFGVGVNMNPATLHALAYFPGMTAPITCLASFAFPFGGTITLTIMSTVFNNRSGENHMDPKSGIVWAYVSVIPIMWLSVLVVTFLGNVWLGKDGNHEIVHGSWFWSLLRGRKLEKVTMARMEDARSAERSEETDLRVVTPGRSERRTDLERGI